MDCEHGWLGSLGHCLPHHQNHPHHCDWWGLWLSGPLAAWPSEPSISLCLELCAIAIDRQSTDRLQTTKADALLQHNHKRCFLSSSWLSPWPPHWASPPAGAPESRHLSLEPSWICHQTHGNCQRNAIYIQVWKSITFLVISFLSGLIVAAFWNVEWKQNLIKLWNLSMNSR